MSADSATDAWAVGYEGVNGDRTLVEHWDGTSWTHVPSPNPGPSLDSLWGVSAFSPTDVWAVGYYNQKSGGLRYRTMVIHWDGTGWTQVKSPNAGNYALLEAVSGVSPDDVWAVGFSMTRVAGEYLYDTLTMHWDGASWTAYPSPNPGGAGGSRLNAVSAVSSDDAWAVGCAPYSPNRSIYLHWDGTAWTKVPRPPGSKQTCVAGVSAAGASRAWTVSGGRAGKALIEHWDGASWSLQASGPVGALSGVSALSPVDAWAVGAAPRCCGRTGTRPLTRHWDGHAWTTTAIRGPAQARSVDLWAVDDRSTGDAWAVGSAYKISRNTALIIEHWDGTEWTLVKVPPG